MANNTDWLNISQMTGGTGETALSLTALTNSSLQPKTATITARNTQYNVSDTTTVTIQGFQPTLTLSRSTLRFDSTGGTATFTVYSNTAWTINFPALVHSYSTSAGTGDTEVTVVLAPNTDQVSKVEVGTVQDIFGVNQLYLTIVQESFIVELTVTPDDDIVFANTGSSTSVTIDCNADWEIVCPNWAVPSVVSGGSGTTTVTFTAGENGPTDRSGEITVYAGSKEVVISVLQPFYIPDHLVVTPTAYTFPYSASSTVFVVDSYPEWSAEIIETGQTSNFEVDEPFIKVTFNLPSGMTMPLYTNGQSGNVTTVYVGAIRQYGATAYTFSSGGVYDVYYCISNGGRGPNLSGNRYITDVYVSNGVGSVKPVSNSYYGGFYECISLTGVTIDSNSVAIGDSAYSGGEYNSVIYDFANNRGRRMYYVIGNNVTTLGQRRFESAGSVEIPETITSIGNGCFSGSGISSITIPSGVTILPEDCFWECTNLSYVVIPDTITEIGDRCFRVCTSLTNVIVPDSVQTIGNEAFAGCNALETLSLGSGITDIGAVAFSYCSSLTGITLPDALTAIPASGFSNCTSLQTVSFGSNINYIYADAFRSCTSLTSVTLPDSVISLGEGAFRLCTSLSFLHLGTNFYTFGNDCFSGCTALKTLSLNCWQIIRKNSSRADYNAHNTPFYRAFYGLKQNMNITLGNNVHYIGDYCFSYLYGVTGFTFPSGLTGIGAWAIEIETRYTYEFISYAQTAPTISPYISQNGNGTLYYPAGSDYSTWLERLGGGWTGVEI